MLEIDSRDQKAKLAALWLSDANHLQRGVRQQAIVVFDLATKVERKDSKQTQH